MSQFMRAGRANLNKALRERIESGKLFDNQVGQYIYHKKGHTDADGWVHPSQLNWNSSPESQAKRLLNKYRHKPDVLKRFHIGDKLHTDISEILADSSFHSADIEQHIEVPELLFRGTPDLYGRARIIGDVLVEIKTHSTYSKDTAGGKKLFNFLDKNTAIVDLADEYPDQVDEIFRRLCLRPTLRQDANPEHWTQVFTYAWILLRQNLFRPKWVCVLYVNKEHYYFTEFWKKVSVNKDLVYKARDNYFNVLEIIKRDGKHLRNN